MLAVILYFGISFAVQTVHVEGLSMFATLDNNDYLIANKVDYKLHPPQRGDIVILRPPTLSTTDYIKRVIALPGERLLIHDGVVYINGHKLDEPYLKSSIKAHGLDTRPCGPFHVPKDDLFVMGDNRPDSNDSRYGLGYIPIKDVIGRAFVIIWPPSRIRWLG